MAADTENEMMVLALFEPSGYPESLVENLTKTGVPEEAVEVLSPLPLHEAALSRTARVPLHVITIMAGLAGIGIGVFFSGGTALLYPIVTGGKPIVAPPVVGIISFETMMLVAIVATFAVMLIRLRSGSRNTSERDPRIDDGHIEVIVSLPPDAPLVEEVHALLRQAGALEIRRRHPAPSVPHALDEKRHVPAALLAAAYLLCGVQACSRDMQEQPSYQPQEAPRLHSPIGSVPRDSRSVIRSTGAPAALDEGPRLFRVNCAHCHGAQATGEGPVAPYLREKPTNLRNPEVRRLSEDALFQIVTDGKDVMPPFKGELSAGERRSLASYIKSLSPP